MSQEEQSQQNASPASPFHDQILDMRRTGSFDQCWKMLAEKITNGAFWLGAELFLALTPPLGGHQNVRETLARHIRHMFGLFIRWEDLLLVPNEHCALEAFAQAFCSPGDVLLCPAPFADPELPAILSQRTEVELRPVKLGEKEELELADLDRAKEGAEAEGRRVRALLLHNPHPVLASIRGGDRRLARILEWTSERDLYLLVDESLATFNLWEFNSCLGLDHRGQLGQKLVWLWSGAKHFSLPGLEFAAILVSRPEPLQHFLQVHPCAPLVQFLTAKLLEDYDWASDLFARRNSRLKELRRLSIEGLAEMGIGEVRRGMEVDESNTQWILADLRKFLPKEDITSERALREELAKEGRLLLNSGEQLGMEEFGIFRLRVGQTEMEVQEALSRLKSVLERRRQKSAGGEPVEWERMDLSKYGGKGIAWETVEAEEEDGQREEEEERKEEEVKQVDEERDFQGNELEANQKQWAMPAPAYFTYEDIRRLSMIREEEGEDEVLKQVFGIDGERRKEEGREVREEADDAVMREVFAIFPAERLRWKQPLVEEKSASEDMSLEEVKKEEKRGEEMEEEEKHGQEEEEAEEVTRVEEHNHVELKMDEEEEDVRNGLDVHSREGQMPEGKSPDDSHPKWPTTLTDFSFIEELVRSSTSVERTTSSRMEPVDEREFYDEASTEEEEREAEEEEEYSPLAIEVPMPAKTEQIEEAQKEGDFGESSDSRRIIQIIDQIFHEAVEIRDFSSSSSDSHPNQAVSTRQEHWPSRSDSGLAADSPPDLSFSPLLADQNGHQLERIEERTEHSMDFVDTISPEPTRNEQMLFEAFQEGPLQTSTLAREVGHGGEEERRLGPTAQMLDDSGIFVEMPPGSLSIDFPLLVPVKYSREAAEGEGIEEATLHRARQLDEKETGFTVDLKFLAKVEEEERSIEPTGDGMSWVEELVLTEAEHKEVAGKTTIQIRGSLENAAQIGWQPLENLAEEMEPGMQWFRVDSEELAEQRREEEEEERMAQTRLAAMMNEGSAFCPLPSPERGRSISRESAESVGGVATWKPLDQMEELAELRKAEEMEEEEMMGGGHRDKKFSETLDELEAGERSSRPEAVISEDLYKSSVMESVVEVEGGRKRSQEPIDVVAEWNARRMARKEEEVAKADETELELDLQGKGSWAAKTEVTLPARGEDRAERHMEAWRQEEEDRSRVEEQMDGQRVKTLVRLDAPKKPPRSALVVEARKEEAEQMGEGQKQWRRGEGAGEAEELNPEKDSSSYLPDIVDIPGRSQAYQVHHRMQMRRKESSRTKGRRAKSKDRVILEHMNITEVDYLGGLSGREERAEKMITCISTRINQWAPDEFFRHLPFEGFQEGEGERMSKYMEVRRRRSQSVPSISANQMEGDEIGRTETRTVSIRRLDSDRELEKAKADGELYSHLDTGKEGQGQREFVLCRNPEHNEGKDHCDPKRLYRIRRSTMMSENGYKKMKREQEAMRPEKPEELHSKFETVHYERRADSSGEHEEPPEVIRRTIAKHKLRRPRRPRSPARITVTSTRGGPAVPGELIDRVIVRHTPGSSWIVSSVYRTTEYGWERTALRRSSAAEVEG